MGEVLEAAVLPDWLPDKKFDYHMTNLFRKRDAHLRYFAEARRSLDYIGRFADVRQEDVDDPGVPMPLPDGSNLANTWARAAVYPWEFYRAWLTWCHSETLLNFPRYDRPPDDLRTMEVPATLLHWSQLLLRDELVFCAPKEGTTHGYRFPQTEGSTPFWTQNLKDCLDAKQKRMKILLLRAIGGAGEEATTALGINSGEITDEEIHAAMESCRELKSEFMDIPLPQRMLACLVGMQAAFEKDFFQRHVEDAYYSKRIRLMNWIDEVQVGALRAKIWREVYGDDIFKNITQIQMSLRKTYGYRFIQWRFGRPWQQLYMVWDTARDPGVADAIGSVQELMRQHPKTSKMLEVHPIALSDIELQPCQICYYEIKDQQLAVKLSCKHFYHSDCIWRFWDEESRHDYSCPTRCFTADTYAKPYFQLNPLARSYDDVEMDAREYEWALEWLAANPGAIPDPQVQVAIAKNSYTKFHTVDKEKFTGVLQPDILRCEWYL